jgi:hypothetical protein
MAQLLKRAASLAIIAGFAISAASVAAATQAPTSAVTTTPATTFDVKAGATVRDSKGVQVAKIVEMQGANVVLDTGQTKIAVPMTFLMKDSQGLMLNITADQFNAAIAKAHARAEAAKAQQPSQPQPTPPKP